MNTMATITNLAKLFSSNLEPSLDQTLPERPISPCNASFEG
jgi:hypothetical protein